MQMYNEVFQDEVMFLFQIKDSMIMEEINPINQHRENDIINNCNLYVYSG